MILAGADSSQGTGQFGTRKVGSGNEVEQWTETPSRRFSHKMQPRYRGLQAATQNRVASHGLYRLLNRGAKKAIPRRVNSVAGSNDYMIYQTIRAIAQFQFDLLTNQLCPSHTAISGHRNLG